MSCHVGRVGTERMGKRREGAEDCNESGWEGWERIVRGRESVDGGSLQFRRD